MEWRIGTKFLADQYNKWREQYTWYMEITDYESENNGGEISVEVKLTKYDENREPITTVSAPQSALIDEVLRDGGSLEEIEELDESQKTNLPEEDDDRTKIRDLL